MWRDHRVALELWHDAYVLYLRGGSDGPPALRRAVDDRAEEGDHALRAAGCAVGAPNMDGRKYDHTLAGMVCPLTQNSPLLLMIMPISGLCLFDLCATFLW